MSRDLAPSFPSRDKTLATLAKNYQKADINVFCGPHILIDFFSLAQIFCSLGKTQLKVNLKDQYQDQCYLMHT